MKFFFQELLYNRHKDSGYFINILKARRKVANKAKKAQNETQRFDEGDEVDGAEQVCLSQFIKNISHIHS